MPALLREHTWWLTSFDRHPDDYTYSQAQWKLEMSMMYARWAQKRLQQQGQESGVRPECGEPMTSAPSDMIEIHELRVFAQMYRIEEGELEILLRLPYLHPRRLTLTIRHADWWFWEDDEQLRFEADWLENVGQALSSSTREVVIELETLSRKKAQLDHVAAHIARNWFFRRRDGVVLFGDVSGNSNELSTWRGASSWAGQRWVRDETSPGTIDYCIIAVPFRLRNMVEKRGGEIDSRFHTMPYTPHQMRVTAPGERLAEQGWVACDMEGR
ncbi:hypothetical protein NLU13_0014 [Sarocladium strictum]|uniref:Uncharacterized protein n=1 Tax=Sarocladium strictum TaxID=5046 RepID=A0AA39GNA6_SARSR|nr:hypothetical protein NLU13_0014 [Sarocladium strictum]